MSIVRADTLQASVSTPNKRISNAWGHTTSQLFGTKYCWAIDHFSYRKECTGIAIKSPVFTCALPQGNIEVQLMVYPSGISSACGLYVSAYVQVISKGVNLNAKAKMGLINYQQMEKVLFNIDKSVTLAYGQHLGSDKFVERSKLFSTNSEYQIPEDMFTIFCEFSVVQEGVNIRCSNFTGKVASKTVSEDIAELFKTQKYSDFTLVVDGRNLKVHKIILAARSPLFAEIMPKDPTINRMEINELPYKAVLEFLRYIYTGLVEDIDEISKDLLLASIKYKMEGLKPICYDKIISNMDVSSAAELLMFAHTNKLEELKKASLIFYKKHAKAIMETDGFQKLRVTCPELILNELLQYLAI